MRTGLALVWTHVKKSLKYALTVALIALQAGALALVLVTSRGRTNEVLAGHLERHQSEVAHAIADETADFLMPAEEVAHLTALLDGTLASAEMEDVLLNQLVLNDQLAAVFIGGADGSFFMVSRDEAVPDGFRTKTISVSADTRTTELRYLGSDFTVISELDDPEDTYDPRGRPWYEGALNAQSLQWTDPYVFFTSRQPGITVAVPTGSDGRVVGVDVELSALSDFVADRAAREESSVFVADSTGTVVALSSAIGSDIGQAVIPVAAVADPVVRSSYSALLEGTVVDGQLHSEIAYGESAHHATFVEMPELGWVVGIAGPDDAFLGELRANQDRNVTLSLAIGLLAALVAVPLIFGFSRPIERLQDQASTDPVTGLPNRRSLIAMGDRLLADPGAEVVVVMMDIDHFKITNDTYGHAVGDEVLRAISQRISGSLRDNDIVGRWGGDEFCIFLPSTNLETGTLITERLRHLLAVDPIQTGAGPLNLTCSFGVAERKLGADLEISVGAADLALLEAKDAGKNVVRVFGDALVTNA